MTTEPRRSPAARTAGGASLTDRLPRVPHRLTSTLLGLAVPAALMAVGLAVAFAWRDRLPDRVANHWGPGGVVDGTSTFGNVLLVVPTVGVPFALLGWAIAFFAGSSAMVRRFAVGISVWGGGFTAGMVLGILQAQLDVPTAVEARPVDAAMALAFAVPLVLAGLAAWAMPGDPVRPAATPVPAGAPRLDLPDGEVATWVRRVEWVHPAWIVAGILLTCAIVGFSARMWWFAGILAVFLTVIVGGMASWTVTVDARGLVARPTFPRPRLVVPLDEVEHAEVVQVSPLRQFGGWGLRTGFEGRVGVVLRSGEGIEVHRTGGRRVVVTVDDAATGAALLNTLAERARA